MYNLSDGTRVQRDWYSSFLLYCCDFHTLTIDKFRCRHEFAECLEKERALIAWIKANKIKVRCQSLYLTVLLMLLLRRYLQDIFSVPHPLKSLYTVVYFQPNKLLPKYLIFPQFFFPCPTPHIPFLCLGSGLPSPAASQPHFPRCQRSYLVQRPSLLRCSPVLALGTWRRTVRPVARSRCPC